MDIGWELAVREAMFEVLDQRVALARDGNLPWHQTENFEFGGQSIVMRQVSNVEPLVGSPGESEDSGSTSEDRMTS